MMPDANKNNSHVKSNRTRTIVGVALLMLLIVLTAEAAYIKGRPIIQTGGEINQGYLWGGGGIHEGVDFFYATGTAVHAIASGTVVQLEETLANNEHLSDWGNFVLLRHDQLHYDRTTGRWSHVYSMYLHLSRLSVQPIEGEHVLKGEWIANVDNTGRNSDGEHLHLQIVIHDLSTAKLEPDDTLESSDRSRNAELWLPPYSYQVSTARVVGKVTNTNGDPVGNLVICGMDKPAQFSTNFQWARTYAHAWMNPDDILVENFATTDVSTGTYNISAYNNNCSGTLYRDLRTYTFQANKTTYIGLYPMYLPMLHENSTRNSTIITRNNSTSFRTKTETTFVRDTGLVSTNDDRTDDLAPRDHVLFSPPSSTFPGSARVVGSQDEAVAARIEYRSGSYDEPAGYSGITAELGVGTRGWEKAGTTIYVPLVKNKCVGRSSEIYITNVGTDTAAFTVTYYAQNGTSHAGGNFQWQLDQTSFISVNGRAPEGAYYSARIQSTNNQPLAVVVLEGDGYPPSSRPAMYNGFSAGHTTLYAPIVKKEYPNTGTPSQSTTGITVQNVTASTATVNAYYYDMNGVLVATVPNFQVPPYSPFVLFNPLVVPNGFLGSVRLVSNQAIVGQMSESNITVNGGRRMMSNLALGNGASRTVVFPLWYDPLPDQRAWVCGVNVRHAGSAGPTTVTARWYDTSGAPLTCNPAVTGTLDNEHDALNFYNESCPADIGSLVLESSSKNIVAVASCADSGQNNFINDIVFTVNGSNR